MCKIGKKLFFGHNFLKNKRTEPSKVKCKPDYIHYTFLGQVYLYDDRFGLKWKMKKKKIFSSEKVKCSDLLQTLKQHRGLVGAYYTNIFLQNSQRFGSNRFPQLQIFFDSRTVKALQYLVQVGVSFVVLPPFYYSSLLWKQCSLSATKHGKYSWW